MEGKTKDDEYSISARTIRVRVETKEGTYLTLNGVKEDRRSFCAHQGRQAFQSHLLHCICELSVVSISAEVLYLIVLTQVFYLVWNIKSIIFFARLDREKLFADAGAGEFSSDGSTSLPRITAILAARNEPEPVLRRSLLSLLSLDYPVEKKEILLVTDSDDMNTCMIADRLSQELGLVHVVVPKNSDPSWSKVISEARGRGAKWADIDAEQLPYSKPRALTYALPRATGQIVTVVDAEDVQGDPLVFRKAARCLEVKGYDAVQGRLRFVNYRDSWLSLQAVGDYSFWFGWLLPKIRFRGLPVALGGTCYYVRRDVLDSVGGWDPTNVTEDLELGLRLYGCGYRVGIIDVDTYEESPRSLLRTRYDGGWANQRTRWIRGTLYTISRLGRYRREFSVKKEDCNRPSSLLLSTGHVRSISLNYRIPIDASVFPSGHFVANSVHLGFANAWHRDFVVLYLYPRQTISGLPPLVC